ncbi:hypothetical protein [Deinococcus radiotolerans]|uniref:Uncharacterized protein n=1 Tax=Deinococcus radiotolerans TaxID=1309407 RepID=A0ABQ2FQZ0_9DEIO|nr:hypothetical protein [Deinococcus radiotolerans]GGL18247.1 hypothetical protein GCM10010844_41390 [Deinococcus radiotolerans]
MKRLALLLLDDTPAPATDFGSVPPGTAAPNRSLRLVNTGDETVSGIRVRVENESADNGEYRVTVQGTALTGDWTALPDLAPTEAFLVLESWLTPAGVAETGVDHGLLRIQHHQ